ncbi:MAG: FAA hydrolase family protein [Desulforudis sp.]|nr:MAG: FAA hydrolase family protein [Desulforudis sp.]
MVKLAGDPFQEIRETGNTFPITSVRLLAPCRPSKIICVGLNYRDHAAEFGHAMPDRPILFMKPPSAVIGTGDEIRYRGANDVTARNLQRQDGQWTRSKTFDTFCSFGPYIVTGRPPADIKVELYVNRHIRQESSLQMIFGYGYLVSYISRIMTLWPGDVILSGTPEGVGSLVVSDVVRVAVGEAGSLENTVI